MTNKEAIEYGKKWDEAIESRGDTPFSEARQFLSLAIKALEIVNDVNHKIYRNENCPQKHKCYDYQGYHCTGCSWEKKGDTE